jgi:hypothetical protein
MIRTTTLCGLFVSLLFFLTPPLAAQDTTEFLFTWPPNPEPDIAGYVIYRSLNDTGGFEAIDSVDASTHSYTDSNLQKGTIYYYRIIAKNSGGERSAFSNRVSGITIPQDADDATKNICRITGITQINSSTYEVAWSTLSPTIGFIQFGRAYDFETITDWNNDSYSNTHTVTMGNLISPQTYILRAVSYTNQGNMFISAIDTLEIGGEEPVAPTAPLLSIYPVPYHPSMGTLYIENLPSGGTVTVYNENGLEVWSTDVGSEHSLNWDGTNAQGNRVMSGVYYVIVKDSSGNVIDRRPIMIVNNG